MDALVPDASNARSHPVDVPTARELICALLRAATRVSAAQAQHLRALRLSPSAYHVLVVLRTEPQGALQLSALADRLSITRASMSGLIDRLEAKALVARRPHARDGRRILVSLTDAGTALLDERGATFESMLQGLFANLTHADQQQLLRLLQRTGATDRA